MFRLNSSFQGYTSVITPLEVYERGRHVLVIKCRTTHTANPFPSSDRNQNN